MSEAFLGTKLTMNLGPRSYEIILRRGALQNLYQFANLNRRVAVVTDSGVPPPSARPVAAPGRGAMARRPRHGADAELFGDVAAVGDDRRQADAQPVGDLLVDQPAGHERQHLLLALREGRYRNRAFGKVMLGERVFGAPHLLLHAHQRVDELLLAGADVEVVHPFDGADAGQQDGAVGAFA